MNYMTIIVPAFFIAIAMFHYFTYKSLEFKALLDKWDKNTELFSYDDFCNMLERNFALGERVNFFHRWAFVFIVLHVKEFRYYNQGRFIAEKYPNVYMKVIDHQLENDLAGPLEIDAASSYKFAGHAPFAE